MPDHAVSPVLRPEVESDDRRTGILLAVVRVIVRDGVDGLRMAAVAREAGVSSALLHYHFATREEMIRQAFDLHDRIAAAASVERVARIADPVERIRDRLLSQLADDPDVRDGWVMWAEMQHLALFHDDLRASVIERSLRWVGSIAEMIGAAQSAGRIRAELDAAE
ncbi:MAG: TetR/AcrR family transcriptional regulator, partial [Actinomycetota bacterium]